MKPLRRFIKRGEALAILPEAVHCGPSAMWFDYYNPVPRNARVGETNDIAVVSIRGALDHYSGWCDSYESILERVRMALTGEDVVELARRRSYWAEEGSPESVVPEASPPSHVVLRIDSPGGVVAGLNEAVFAIRRMSDSAGIPLVAYADELAASASYAIACACRGGLFLPRSAVAGSIGVISTMFDQVEADKKMGVRVVTITSGARKADGHPHVTLSDAAITAEQGRVDAMAKQFFRLVADVRPLSPKAIRGLEAGIFLGEDAVKAQLADDVLSWPELIESLAPREEGRRVKEKPVAKLGKDESPSTGTGSANSATRATTENPMSTAALEALVTRARKALAAKPGDANLKASLTAYEGALKAAKAEATREADTKKKKVEYKETVTEETGADDEEAETEESDESAESEESDASAEGDDSSDDGDDDEDDDGEEASASAATSELLALVEQATGKKGRRAVGALASLLAQGSRANDRIAKIEKTHRIERKGSLIRNARNERRITPSEAKMLTGKKLAFVEEFIGMRKGAIVDGDDQETIRPKDAVDGTDATTLPANVLASIEQTVTAAPSNLDKKALRDALVSEHLAKHNERMKAAANGAGRY